MTKCAAVFCFTGFILFPPVAVAREYALSASTGPAHLADDPCCDLQPGLRLSCRVKFDDLAELAHGPVNLMGKGRVSDPGSFLLRVDGGREDRAFGFYLNLGTGPEPRVTLPVRPRPGVWYDVAAGWDGTNSWIAVNGKKAFRSRRNPGRILSVFGDVRLGPLTGTLADPTVRGPFTAPENPNIVPGFRFACTATFDRMPGAGEHYLVAKEKEYYLRYDVARGATTGRFNFFVFLDGAWEPHASCACPVVTGRPYRVACAWSGTEQFLRVDDAPEVRAQRSGRCRPGRAPLVLGGRGLARVTDFTLRNDPAPIVGLERIRSACLMPHVGESVRVLGCLENVGSAWSNGVMEVTATAGAAIEPARRTLAAMDPMTRRELAWTLHTTTQEVVDLAFTLRTPLGVACRTSARFVLLPREEPVRLATWMPPVAPTVTHYVDAEAGDDARDGLSPHTAWRTFRNVAALTLGPGERLLLRRGSVFREPLLVGARGTAANWAEIGAYGEGARPIISRNRHLSEHCGGIVSPAYAVVRDLCFCNAGAGFALVCKTPADGHVLVERCLAHHIEGAYRINAHGIPEWRDCAGPEGPGGRRSCGIYVHAGPAGPAVVRDCETYQCSSGFNVSGYNTYVTRMYCHDNCAHNTSPHPYDLASRSWLCDSVFEASGWHASAGTMGIMLAGNRSFVIRGCHFLNQPDSGSHDQGGVDFEAGGDNCRIEACTFRNNAGAAIEVLGLKSPQAKNVHIRRCRFDRNNFAYRNGPAEIQVWGHPGTPRRVACSNGLIEDNGAVCLPGVDFYVNHARTTNDWILANNRLFDFPEDLDRAYPYADPPEVSAGAEIWTDSPDVALAATCRGEGIRRIAWQATEGPARVRFAPGNAASTKARFAAPGDYRVQVLADNGTLWRTSRTAVHILPGGARTCHAWNFAKNLDDEGWRAEKTGMEYEYLPDQKSFTNLESYPVRLVCGDYYVIALKDATEAALVSAEDRATGVTLSPERANTVRIRMQNGTGARQMRLYWITRAAPDWRLENSVAFAVTPHDAGDTLYEARLPTNVGGVRRFKLLFSAEGKPLTGTCRIDYIWFGAIR